MGRIADAFREAWRDYVTDGVPSSGKYNPKKGVIRPIGEIVEEELAGIDDAIDEAVARLEEQISAAAEGMIVGTSWTDLSTNPDKEGARDGQPGRIPNTVTGTHTGYYVNSSGAIVSGTVDDAGEYQWSESLSAWVRTGDLIDAVDVSAAIAGVDDINIRRGSPDGRPGATPTEFFETNNIGSSGAPTSALTALNPARLVAGDYGEAVRVVNQSLVVASRWPFRNEQGHLYEVTYAVQREVDPANAAASTVSVGVQYLNKDYGHLGTSSSTFSDLTISVGRREKTMVVGLDWIAPPGTIYIRPYVVAIGADHTTLVEVARTRDITNTFGVVEHVVNAKSGRVLLDGDSLGGVYYTLPGKAWVNSLSALTDWQFANVSLTSDDSLESWSRFVGGAPIYGSLGARDLDPQHVLIVLFANDANVRDSRTRLFVENLRRKLKASRSGGMNPIIVTEGRKARGIEQAAMSRLAWEEGAHFWEISSEYFCQDVTRNVDYHYSNHPGVRHTLHYSNAIARRISELGRPVSSLKVFRPRKHRQLFAPVYSWTFDGGTTRCWPSATNNGTLVGGAAIVTDALRGPVYQGSANGDRMTFGGSPAMPASYSFAAWINPASFGTSRNILSGGTAGRLNIMLESGRLWIRHGSGSADIDVAIGAVAGEWMHIAVTYDAVRDLLVAYANGAQVASMTGAGAHNCTDPQVGASGTSSSFIGKIDDVNIWDTVLEPWQIAIVAQHRNGLGYDSRQQRHALWKEIEIGHYALSEAQRPYYDALQSLSPTFVAQNSEYQTLQQVGSVGFVDKALLQFVVPGNAANTYGLRLRMKGADGATIHWLSRRPNAPSGGGAYNKSRGFVVASYPVGIVSGDIYSFSGQIYEVNGVTRNKDGAGWIVWAFPEVATSDVSGTLTRVSGSGPNTITFSNTLNFADAAYYAEVDRPYMPRPSVSGGQHEHSCQALRLADGRHAGPHPRYRRSQARQRDGARADQDRSRRSIHHRPGIRPRRPGLVVPAVLHRAARPLVRRGVRLLRPVVRALRLSAGLVDCGSSVAAERLGRHHRRLTLSRQDRRTDPCEVEIEMTALKPVEEA
uniref:LamG domain-containing protein n=1 Tax=Shinella sp. BYT-45 TaxID=3377377 RepID=UPI00397EED74